MREIDYTAFMQPFCEALAQGGAFLTVGGDVPNTMTIGWAQIGYLWRRPIITVLVRPSRYTYGLLNESGRFSVSVPTAGSLRAQLNYAGRISGRDEQKLDGTHGLHALPGQKLDVPVIAECPLHAECTVLHMQDMTGDFMSDAVRRIGYPDGDLHRLYFGEIVACYRTD